jgi:hypothetical protein
MKSFMCVLGVLVAMFGITWAIEGNDFFLYKFFAPKEEQVRQDVFRNSQAYNDGVMQDLYNAQRDYLKGNNEQKVAIRGLVLHRVSSYDLNKLPNDLHAFVIQLRNEDLK